MQLPAYDTQLYTQALEVIAVDIQRLTAYDRLVRSIAVCNESQLTGLRDQLRTLLEDAVFEVLESQQIQNVRDSAELQPHQLEDIQNHHPRYDQ